MSDDEIRAAVIKNRHPNADLEGKSAVYLESRFDSIVETTSTSETVRREMGGSYLRSLNERMDGAEAANPSAKRKEMLNRARNEWQQPLSASKK